ncbi:PF06210 family protein [Leptospira santarosai]|uniref:PF06210 family protein n=1 Tax=Leptospira santarosai TaxID=28183 RepID=A0A2P1QNN4_9LEPT|nr:PF06210 family protein [Leptospira santarosai]
MSAWIFGNVTFLTKSSFDPYPFILLNLILSCIAALQAPIIMMSQNRQEAKDRIRSENDYKINLKAEIEIRTLHEKVDHLLLNQWSKMIEVQEIQMEILGEISNQLKRKD